MPDPKDQLDLFPDLKPELKQPPTWPGWEEWRTSGGSFTTTPPPTPPRNWEVSTGDAYPIPEHAHRGVSLSKVVKTYGDMMGLECSECGFKYVMKRPEKP